MSCLESERSESSQKAKWYRLTMAELISLFLHDPLAAEVSHESLIRWFQQQVSENRNTSESNTYNRTCDHDFWCALPSHLNIAIIIIISSPISFIICYSSLSQIFWCQHHATEMDFSPGTHQLLKNPFSDVLKMRYWLKDI